MAGISDKKKIIYFIFQMTLENFIIEIKMKNVLKFSNSFHLIKIFCYNSNKILTYTKFQNF